ncbi:MAG: folE [Glaciihabitans sp.]|nr:folE [Glaciihabitans sp.]
MGSRGTDRASGAAERRARLEAAVAELLAAIGEDTSRPGLQDTPRRVAEAYAELLAGESVDAVALLASGSLVADEDELGEMVVMRDIDFRSICEQHLLPFTGIAHLAYLPAAQIVGLSSIPRVIDAVAGRLQTPENLAEQVVDVFELGIKPAGVLLVLDTEGCLAAPGRRTNSPRTVTVASRGCLAEPAARAEALALIGLRSAG